MKRQNTLIMMDYFNNKNKKERKKKYNNKHYEINKFESIILYYMNIRSIYIHIS